MKLTILRKLIKYHPRLWASVVLGAMAFFLVPLPGSMISRILFSWDCAVAVFLLLMSTWMVRLSAERMRSRYVEEDESAPVILAIVVLAALLSVVAIVEPLANVKQVAGTERLARIVLAASTLVESWLLVPVMFTTHYADMYYSADARRAPLTFPNTPMPAFWDFAYFSFTIAAACQTSDVSTNDAAIRKFVLAHTLISFFFNASILGFAINVTAGLLGG